MSENNNIYSKPILFSVMALVVILVGSIVTTFYPLARDEMHPRLETLDPYTALELAGRDVYQREGCMSCHTQTVRPLKTEVMRYGDFSKAGENYYERPFLWGSRRTGPDLARIGGKYPDDWHMQHFVNPRRFAAKSNMPAYPWLEDAKLDQATIEAHMKTFNGDYTPEDISGKTELEALTAYMQYIGRSVPKLRLVELTEADYAKFNYTAKGTPEAVTRGKAIFLTECSGCHGIEGEGNIGGERAGADMDDMTAFLTVANGNEFGMPGFINTMTKDQIALVVEFLRSIAAEADTESDSDDEQ